jgi:hypothetical protein
MFLRTKWTPAAAKGWLSAHGYKTPEVDTTAEYHRYRQAPPFSFQKGTFRTITLGAAARGIKAVIAVPRDKANPLRSVGPMEHKPYRDKSRYGDETLKKGTFVKHIGGREKLEIVARTGTRYYSAKNAKGETITIKVGEFEAFKAPKKRKTNPSKKSPWVPTLLVDLADVKSIDLEGGEQLKFPFTGNFAMCATRSGRELWIVSRKGGKNVRTTDKKGEDLYEDFTGFEHDDVGKMIHINPKNMIRIGRAMDIVYRSDKFSKSGDSSDYIHTFRAYPTVSVDNVKRPQIVALRGGRIRVTKEGITG